MSEARIDTAQERPREADGAAGKHRGVAAEEDAATQPHGKHRRPAATEEAA
ncbi:hypothetical protein [Streptomyces sp. NPDC020965]|uniref:hypothetical protein n=1 Tax=Streptomyces sp. NPDC020965 TaxID=3365105 RepID=UPI00379AB5FF